MDQPTDPKTPAPASAGSAAGRVENPVASMILVAFVTTFVIARIMVLLIMTHRIPSLYLHMGGTHVHHLNYGIFILSAVGGFLLLRQPKGRELRASSALYGIGLALTFDEFGMWVHLGGPYWQRASFDAVVVVGALLALIWVSPTLWRLKTRGWVGVGCLILALAGFWSIWGDSLRFAAHRLSPVFQQIEAGSPP